MRLMAATKSPTTRGKKQVNKDTVQEDAPATVVTKASVATNTSKGNNMSDVSSILEFSEDVATAEAVPPLPEGDYPAEIRAASVKTGQTSGKPYGAVQFFIAPESYPADYTDGDPDGVLLTYSRVSVEDTPASRHRLRKFVEAIGAKAGTKIDMNEWIGLTATVSIKHDTYEGEKRAAIQRVISA
jgi:hypothetical protein